MTSPADENASEPAYRGPLGLMPVPYSRGIFNFHWFNFFNAICFQIILGAPIVLLAKELGANSITLGIIESFTPLMTMLQLPANGSASASASGSTVVATPTHRNGKSSSLCWHTGATGGKRRKTKRRTLRKRRSTRRNHKHRR